MSDVYVSALCWCGELLPITKNSVYATPHVLIVLILDVRLTAIIYERPCLTQSITGNIFVYMYYGMTIWIRFLLGVRAEIMVSGGDSAFSRHFQ